MTLAFGRILEAASTVTVEEQDLQLKRLVRWSNRQKAAVRLDGLVGRVVFAGEHLPAFQQLLRAGELFHVGKGTVFGLGKYRMVVG